MMKSARFTLPALLAGVMAVSPQALAQSTMENEELSVGLRLGAYKLDGDRLEPPFPGFNVDDGFTLAPGIELRVPLTPTWSMRSFLDFVSADIEGKTGSASGYAIGVDALYNFSNGVY